MPLTRQRMGAHLTSMDIVRLAFHGSISMIKNVLAKMPRELTLGMFSFHFVQDSRKFSRDFYSETLMINRAGLVLEQEVPGCCGGKGSYEWVCVVGKQIPEAWEGACPPCFV